MFVKKNRVLKTGLGAATLLAALLLSACGKPADAPAAASAPGAAVPAAPAAAAEKKHDGPDPLAHEGIPGLSDMFSKKKEGEGH
jgi:hypothetical protein